MDRLRKIVINALLSLCILSVLGANVFAAEFPDMPRTHKNYTAVESLVELGVIAGYEDGYFRPEREITRTEFCALMARTLGYSKDDYQLKELPFTDVKPGYWGEAYISFCFELGLINGMGDGTFLPADKVTMEQATKMTVCAIGREDEANSYIGEKWYSGYIVAAHNNNLYYKVDPILGQPAVRGDIAQMVYNMVESGLLEEDEEEEELLQPDEETVTEVDRISPEIREAFKNKDFSQVGTILIDAGHNYTGKDIGAENVELGLREEEITWGIADKLRKNLELMGYTVVMTREKETDSIGNTSVMDSLQARVDLGHESLADLFISIHCNAGGGAGTEVYCFRKGGYAGTLAAFVQEEITDRCDLYDRGIKTSNFFVIQNTLMPAILIETGFIDNQNDAEIISSEDGQWDIADAIADAVKKYDETEIIESSFYAEETTEETTEETEDE